MGSKTFFFLAAIVTLWEATPGAGRFLDPPPLQPGFKGQWALWEKCPPDTFVHGISFSWESDTTLGALRFLCSAPGLSRTEGFYTLNISSPEQNGGERKWSDPVSCERGLATGVQLLESADSNATLNVVLICSDEGLLVDNAEMPSGLWSKPNRCNSQEAICATQAEVLINDGVTSLQGLRFDCCEIQHPAQLCTASDTVEVISDCDNVHGALAPLTCSYTKNLGISFNDEREEERSVFEDLGFDLPSASAFLAAQPDFDLDPASGQIVFSPETSTEQTVTAEAGSKVTVTQVTGSCGFYTVHTNFIDTKTHMKSPRTLPKDKDGFFDVEGMQGDSWDDSFEDEDEDAGEEIEEAMKAGSDKAKDVIASEEMEDDDWSASEEEDAEAKITEMKTVGVKNAQMKTSEVNIPEVKAEDTEAVKSETVEDATEEESDEFSDLSAELEAQSAEKPEAESATVENIPVTEAALPAEDDSWEESEEEAQTIEKTSTVQEVAAKNPEAIDAEKNQEARIPHIYAAVTEDEIEEWDAEDEVKSVTDNPETDKSADAASALSFAEDDWDSEEKRDGGLKSNAEIAVAPLESIADVTDADNWSNEDDNKVASEEIEPEVKIVTEVPTVEMSPEVKTVTEIPTMELSPEVKTVTEIPTMELSPEVKTVTEVPTAEEVSPEVNDIDSFEDDAEETPIPKSESDSVSEVELLKPLSEIGAPLEALKEKEDFAENDAAQKQVDIPIVGDIGTAPAHDQMVHDEASADDDFEDFDDDLFGADSAIPQETANEAESANSVQNAKIEQDSLGKRAFDFLQSENSGSLPPLLDLNSLSESARNIGDQISKDVSAFAEEGQKVIDEVKATPIYQEGQKRVEETLKTVVEAALGVGGPDAVDSVVEADYAVGGSELTTEEGEEALKKAGGFVGYIVGGMVVCVIIIVIVIFIIEKRGKGRDSARASLRKGEYSADVVPAPEPLLTHHHTITIGDNEKNVN